MMPAERRGYFGRQPISPKAVETEAPAPMACKRSGDWFGDVSQAIEMQAVLQAGNRPRGVGRETLHAVETDVAAMAGQGDGIAF